MTDSASPFLAVYWGSRSANSATVARALAQLNCPLIPIELESELTQYLESRRHIVVFIDYPTLPDNKQISDSIRDLGKVAAVVSLHDRNDGVSAVEALKAGALDALFLETEAALLLPRVTLAIEAFRDRQATRTNCQLVEQRVCTLSLRERKVLKGMLEGVSNKQMAREIEVTERAIEMRRAAILKKLECQNVAQIIRMITRWELLAGDTLDSWLK